MIYLDHSATTPTDPRVVQAMLPYFTEIYGNASSTHSVGRKAEHAIRQARETIARILHCQPSEIIFTSGGSESDNLAVRGAAWNGRGKHLITTPIEHGAVGKTMLQLAETHGFEADVVPVDVLGCVDSAALISLCRPDTALISIMYANNEVGTVQPITEMTRHTSALFHTDAVQAAGQLPLNVQALGVDLLSLSAHKFYGPKGIGALYVREGVKLSPSQTGGGQERSLRAGTHATPLIVGMAKALELAYEEFDQRTAHLQRLRDALIDGVLTHVPGALLTGHPEHRLPAHASFVFEGVNGAALVDWLDAQGIAASGASACKAGSAAPSGTLLAMGYAPELAVSSLRLTVGIHTTFAEIEKTVQILIEAVRTLRKFSYPEVLPVR